MVTEPILPIDLMNDAFEKGEEGRKSTHPSSPARSAARPLSPSRLLEKKS
jgi:hypothetical protein